MRSQCQPHLGGAPPDEGSGAGVAEPEDPVPGSAPTHRNVLLEPLRDPRGHEGHLRVSTLGGQEDQPAPFDTRDREAEDFPDPQATPGLQLQQQSSPEGGCPVDQFIDGVAVEARPERRPWDAKGLAQQGGLAGIRNREVESFDREDEERCELRVAEAGRTGGRMSDEGGQKRVDVLTRQALKIPLPVGLQIFFRSGA